ncbi:hypothetical protein EYF80_005990 [Liparis tanakae]|uniref:Uncharacterized protein n=1 Tax=Liparis tanakae TaxID=230148 RepID=A0A4Z2J1V9_9TELE|nr:hypothetical protein EYF80_005990 [Liparis tanakae]
MAEICLNPPKATPHQDLWSATPSGTTTWPHLAPPGPCLIEFGVGVARSDEVLISELGHISEPHYTTNSEPLSAPSSQHPLRKEAGQAAPVPHKLCTAISCRDTGYFGTEGRIALRPREDPSDRKAPSMPPSSSCTPGSTPDRLVAGWWFSPRM